MALAGVIKPHREGGSSAEALVRIGPVLLAKMSPSWRLPSGLPAEVSLRQVV